MGYDNVALGGISATFCIMWFIFLTFDVIYYSF